METSSNAYEQVYKPSDPEDNGKYYEGYVDKKERFKWVQYWCVLKEHNMHFFKDVSTQIKDNYVGFLALEHPTTFDIVKSKEGKYEWTIKTKKGKTTLRTSVASLRDDWINSMERSLKNEPPSKESYILKGSGPVSPKNKGSASSSHQIQSQSSFKGAHYVMSEKQVVASFQEMSNTIGEGVADMDKELRVQDELLNGNEGWYQTSICREEVETILSSQEKGVFIVRDYVDNRTNNKMGYVISLKDEVDHMRHHRIRKTDGLYCIVGYEERSFESLHNLLRFFISSQRKKITLVPFDPEKHQISCTGYENMGSREPELHDHQHPKVGRSKSAPHRRLPASPPKTKFDRASFIEDRSLPSPPERQIGHDQPNTGGYERMTSPSKSLKNRALPTPPVQGNGHLYMSPSPFPQLPVTQTTGESYINFQSTAVDESRSYENTENIPQLPVTQTTGESYINFQSTGTVDESRSYENTETNSPYINTGVTGAAQVEEEQAPTLPPRKRISSQHGIAPYVNCPRSNMPGRNPFLKSHSLS